MTKLVTIKADPWVRARALQCVPYRSAKQQPHRRFHGLYDKAPALTGPRGHVKQVPLVRLLFLDPPSPGIP